MRETDKIDRLTAIIRANLQDEIGAKHALFDAPYHTNIGDVLIWLGEKCFLEAAGSRCEYVCSYFTCRFPELQSDTTILFQGGVI